MSAVEEVAMRYDHMITVPAELIAGWKEELLAMPDKKRKNWKGFLQDKQGVRSKVRYAGVKYFGDDPNLPYEFENWQPGNRHGGSAWWPVLDMSVWEDYPDEIKPTSRVGARILRGEDVERAMDDAQQENATGNHHRNPKPVKVPTKAGEPVRA